MRASCLARPRASRAPKRPGHPAVNTSQPTLVVGQPQKRTTPAESAGGVRCAPPPLTEALASSAPASGVPSARPDAPQGVQTLVHHVSELRGWLRGACISSLARTVGRRPSLLEAPSRAPPPSPLLGRHLKPLATTRSPKGTAPYLMHRRGRSGGRKPAHQLHPARKHSPKLNVRARASPPAGL